jgi:type II secretory pathway component PulM
MNAFWRSRSQRERAVLVGGVVAAAILLVVALVWLPLERSRTRLSAEIPRLAASVATMERNAEEVQRVRSLPASTPATVAPTATVAPALGRNLANAQVASIDERRVRITGADVAYGALLETIAAAQSTYGLRVDSARIDALPAAGRVRAELVLARP